jgi:transcriptional regulator with XRE-family HTH domain
MPGAMPPVDLQAFGLRVRNRRQAAGLRQRELATLLEITEPKTISSWETGKSLPRTGALKRLADALGCTLEWLLHGDQPDEAEEATDIRVVRAVRQYAESDPTAPLLTAKDLDALRRVDLGEIEPTPQIVRELALGLLAQRR